MVPDARKAMTELITQNLVNTDGLSKLFKQTVVKGLPVIKFIVSNKYCHDKLSVDEMVELI